MIVVMRPDATAAEIGAVTLGRVENKGRQNRRVSLTLAD